MIKFLLFDFLGISHRNLRKKYNAIYRLKISALHVVPDIFKFEKSVKHANDD